MLALVLGLLSLRFLPALPSVGWLIPLLLLALIVFGPVVGVVLDGYSFNAEPARVTWLVGGVM
ncbi:MAG: hypothetical protein H5U33_19775, partial [Pseudomonas sp.]|nr:hypothetical protein [Pseudomonas sp.]